MKFRIHCDFEVEYENYDTMVEEVLCDTDFIRKHIIVDKVVEE